MEHAEHREDPFQKKLVVVGVEEGETNNERF